MHAVLNYLLAVVAMGLLIALHELGHLLAARSVGIRVSRYSVGFGPTLFEVTRGETTYALAALPLGGYTRVVGMDPSDPEAGHRDSYAQRPVWQRLWVVIAGPLMNELLAVLLVYSVAVGGMPDSSTTVIGHLEPGSVAEKIGLHEGDRIAEIDGQPLERFADLVNAIHAHPGQTIELQVERDLRTRGDLRPVPPPGTPPPPQRGEEEVRTTLQLTAKLDTPPVLGVAPPLRRYGPLDAVPAAIGWTFRTTQQTVGGLALAIAHPSLLQGPLATVRATAHEAERGWQSLVFTLALISLGLAVFNALPLPALDGGRSLFLLFEAVFRRKVSPRFEGLVHGIGLLLLLGGIIALSVVELHGK